MYFPKLHRIEKDIRSDVETVWKNSKFLPWNFTLRTLPIAQYCKNFLNTLIAFSMSVCDIAVVHIVISI